jgi:putative FmdB family regulatory protein
MPIFEYLCRDCGGKFEAIVIAAKSAATCKDCGSKRVDQLLSVFSVAPPSGSTAAAESGPCACGAPRRGMCGE